MSSAAGKTTPDSISEFYGYSSVITVSADVLIVGGGGTGQRGGGLRTTSTGGSTGGGGGAGGYRTFTSVNISTNTTIIVGGAGSLSCVSGIGEAPPGGNGSCSGNAAPLTQGSGGGGSMFVCVVSGRCGQIGYVVRSSAGAIGTYGGNGGDPVWVDDGDVYFDNGYFTSGGGGGAGGDAQGTVGGPGCTWLDGITYAVGGDGAVNCESNTTNYRGYGGCTNTALGSGGGGHFLNYITPGQNGVVVIRYLGAAKFNGGCRYSSGGYTYHCFISSTTLTNI